MIKYLIRRLRLFSKSRKEPYLLFHKVLGFFPDNIEYYQLAVRHRSVSVRTADGNMLSNERLEFLGDAVLNSVVTDILYRRYENEREGFLTNTRSKIVKRDSLNQLAVEIGLDKLMLTSKHVSFTSNNNICGNALEALMGAIYLDYGYKKCKWFVEHQLLKNHMDIDKIACDEVNFKSKIIEWSQKHRLPLEFVLVKEELDAGNKHTFLMRLTISGMNICEATGSSKKESHQNVSYKALQIIEANPHFIQEIIQLNENTVVQENTPVI
ncbi:MAG: ribonuclease [Bacteroidetes bacterium]|nr:ribonuclease [Bacteroidota bacterium]